MSLFSTWIIATAGFGSLIMNAFPQVFQRISYRRWHQGILGLIIIGSLATIINFFIPISPMVSIILMIGGVVLFLCDIRKRAFSIPKVILFGGIGFVLGYNLIYYGIPVPDTGLYHLAAIKWIMESATPFGLANLHTRFGFNSIWFPLGAIIDQNSILFNKQVFILNGVLLISYGTLVADSIFGIIRNWDKAAIRDSVLISLRNISVAQWYFILSILPVILISVKLKNFLCSTSPDYPVFLLTLVFFGFLIEYIEERIALNDVRTYQIVTLVFFICTIKISGIILVPMVLLAIIGQNFKLIHSKTDVIYSSVLRTMIKEIRSIPWIFFAILLFLTVPYGVRGFILSGNPLFPASFGSYIQFPWSVPLDRAVGISNEVTAWARLPGEHYLSSLGNFDWFHQWLGYFITSLLPLILCIIIAGCIAIITLLYGARLGLKHQGSPYVIPTWYPLLTIFIGLAFWFSMYPDFRFALGYLAALPMVLLVLPFLSMKKPYPPLFSIFILLTSTGACFGAGVLTISDLSHQIPEENWNIPFFPDVPYSINETYSGERVYVPVNGSLGWNLPLPNTPYFNRNLTIIRDKQTEAYRIFLDPGRVPQYI